MKNKGKTESIIDDINNRLWNNRYEDSVTALSEVSSVLTEAEKIMYEKGMAYARLNIAAFNFLRSNNDAASENLSKALIWFSQHSAEPGYSRALNLSGNLHESFGDYEKALRFCLQSLDLSAGMNDQESEAETCSQLGLIYTRLNNYPKALEYYNTSLKIREKMNDVSGMASSFNRIGMVMRLTREYEESLKFYNQSLEIRIRNNYSTSVPWTLLGIASTYEEMQQYPKALEFYEKGMIGGDKRCTLQCILGSGRILSALGNSIKAEERLVQSLKMAQDLRASSIVAEAYLGLANHFERSGHTENALKSYKLYHKEKESIQSDETKNMLRNIEISHAVEKSEHEKEIYRLKNIELRKAYDIIEENHKEITSSINYASRIQKALLPDFSEIEELGRNCFILYMPKDVVSGDFYWFKRTGDKLIAVAGDCTGHGVPGALMSMLGISFLEDIVNCRKVAESARILNELSKQVQRVLHQKGEIGEARDGMDISICVIDLKSNFIQYSGAYNNLYLIHNDEMFEYKADRMPIGIFDLPGKKFSTHNIISQSGDLIYMFSDGYSDQFGGDDSKKYKSSNLKSFLLKIHKLSLPDQRDALEKEFRSWKGNNSQIDDVMILGLKIN
jgi:serine phosphatase RsbU (regulator of sigma subunit)